MLPHGILALSISTVVFPAMSRLYQQGRIDEFRAIFAQASRLLFLLSAPAAVLLFFFRVPIVQLLYQRGAFDAASTRLVADPVAFFAIGLVSYALVEVLTRAFYAMHDTRTPVIAGVLTIILNIILCAALVGSFGHVALALSLSLTTTIEGIILFTVLRGRLGAIGPRRQQWLVRASLATLCMVVVAWLVSPRVIASVDATTISWLVRMIFFAFAVVVVGGSYVVAGVMVGIPEFAEGSRRLAARLPIGRRRLSHEHG